MNYAPIFRPRWQALALALLTTCPPVRGGTTANLVAQPLAPRSGPRGATMFRELAPADTGVVTENKYDDPRMWGERARQFEVGAIGTGVAVGDYDGDGRPDLFVVSKTGSCRLFRNLGGWKFADVTDAAGVGDIGAEAAVWKQGAAFADVNNDGLLDLYVCRFDAPNRLYLNRGDGTFVESAKAFKIDVVDASNMAAFCDYDRDGWLDLYLQTNYRDAGHPNGQHDYLFHHNRDGTFTDVTRQAGIAGESYGHSATWWDYDGDGWPDLYVANDFAARDCLYRNNRDGTFADVIDQVVPHMPYSAMGSDLGDVNNDGLPDLLVAEMAATTHEKDMRTMAEVRSRARDPAANARAAPQYPYNALYVNTGAGRMLEASHLTGLDATDWTWSVRFEDLDNDGRLDLHVTNGMFREIHNSDLLQRLLVAENPAERARISRSSPVLKERNLAFRNQGDLTFQSIGASWGLDQNGVSFGAAFGDFDGDGDLDLVFANYQGGVTLLRNDSDSGHRLEVRLRGTRSNRFGVGSRVTIVTATGRQVRDLVLARGYLSTSEPMLHFGLGADAVVARLTVAWPSGTRQTFNNVNADQILTITEPADSPAPVITESPAPSPQFVDISREAGLSLASRAGEVDEFSAQPLLPMRHNRSGPAIAVADLTGGGEDDFVIGGTMEEPFRIAFPQSKPGHFSAQSPLSSSTPPAVNDGPVLIFDADGDGRNDLLITKGGAALVPDPAEYQPRLWLQGRDGFNAADSHALPALPNSVGAAIAGDFDRDGQLDIFLGGRVRPGEYPLAPASVLLRNCGGRFEDVTDALAPGLRNVGMVTSALWTDVDGDGWLDLLITLEWGTVKYFHNREGRGFAEQSDHAGFTSGGSGWWSSLAAADFNGDGRLDYAVGNVGLNTPYRATPAHPALLYYGQFSEGSAPELVEGYYEDDRLLPRRVRRQMGLRIPGVLKRYPTNDRYGRATLGEIVGAAQLAAADKWMATELRSGVFVSQPDGTFRFVPLPRTAQIAPLQGMVAGDFDGDGCADLYAVQNSYAPPPSVGRFDGGVGVFLRGDGHGNFATVPVMESGLLVPGEAKTLVACDLNRDGWPDFFITRNDDTTLAFRNEGVKGRHSFRVVLHGRAGNSSAIGARISCELADGLTRMTEIQAGGGYSSQSTAAQFFGYPESNPPKLLRVRWPSGRESVHVVTEPNSTVILEEPNPT